MAETSFSMDDWRHHLSEQVSELRDLTQNLLDEGKLDSDTSNGLRNVVDNLIGSSNLVNRVVLEGDHHFTDMSDVSIDQLDE